MLYLFFLCVCGLYILVILKVKQNDLISQYSEDNFIE